jgi:hypothetical protein
MERCAASQSVCAGAAAMRSAMCAFGDWPIFSSAPITTQSCRCLRTTSDIAARCSRIALVWRPWRSPLRLPFGAPGRCFSRGCFGNIIAFAKSLTPSPFVPETGRLDRFLGARAIAARIAGGKMDVGGFVFILGI